jgi:hypothetical protein
LCPIEALGAALTRIAVNETRIAVNETRIAVSCMPAPGGSHLFTMLTATFETSRGKAFGFVDGRRSFVPWNGSRRN